MSNLFRRSVPGVGPLRTCRQFIDSLCPENKTESYFYFGCFFSWWIPHGLIRRFLPYILRFLHTIRSYVSCVGKRFRKVEYPYFISQIRFGPRKGTAEGGDPFGSLTKCRDHVSVVPEPMENWNELTLHVSSKYIFNQQYYLAHHLFRYLINTYSIPSPSFVVSSY